MKLVELSIKRPIMMTMVIAILVALGIFAFLDIPIDLFPQVDIPVVTVTTIYPGANPEEVKNSLTRPIEDEVSALAGIKKVRSYSLENASVVLIQFEMGHDINVVAQDVKDKIDAIRYKFPQTAKEPTVLKYDINDKPIMELALCGPNPTEDLFRLANEKLKDRFSQISGVASVKLVGGQERLIRVELDRRRLERYEFTMEDIVKFIKANNIDVPGGAFPQGDNEFTVRVTGKLDDYRKLENLTLVSLKFGPVKLGKIARIHDSFDKIATRAHYVNYRVADPQIFSHANSIGFFVMKQAKSNTMETSAKILTAIELVNKTELPAGCRLYIITDRSDFIKASVSDTTSNIVSGVLLTALVLLLFLHNLRSTLIAPIVLPISYIASFTFMKAFGFSINMLTLGGFSVTVGTLVTNTVVVLENIIRYLKMGKEPGFAAEKGTGEIAVAVAASALTNVVVFVPIALMKGLIGQFFSEFGITVTIVTLFSLIVSFTLTPMMSAKLLNNELIERKGRFGIWFDRQFAKLERWYALRLKGLLQSRPKRLFYIISVLALFVGSLFLVRVAGLEFLPPLDQGELEARVQFPLHQNLDQTGRLVEQIEKIAAEYGDVISVFTQLGVYDDMTRGVNNARVGLRLIPKGQRDYSVREMVNRLRSRLAAIPGAELSLLSPKSFGPNEPAIVLQLTGSNMDTLYALSRQAANITQTVSGCVDVFVDYQSGKPEIKIIPDLNKLADYGLTVYHLAVAVRGGVEGIVASTYREQGREYDIKVSFCNEQVNDPEKIAAIPIATPKGVVRVKDIARLEYSTGPTKIMRLDRNELIQIKANVSKGTLGQTIHELRNRLEKELTLPSGYRFSFAGDMELLQDALSDIYKAALLAVILTFMVLCALLESYKQPIMIMATIPLSFIGVVPSLLITGTSLSVTSMISMIMLVGIVVNNAILLLDYANELRRNRGMQVDEALLEACPVKLRPIIMSTLAIILGMLPLAWASGAGSEARAPIGVVSVGGLLVTTFLTLFIIPAVYKVWEK